MILPNGENYFLSATSIVANAYALAQPLFDFILLQPYCKTDSLSILYQHTTEANSNGSHSQQTSRNKKTRPLPVVTLARWSLLESKAREGI